MADGLFDFLNIPSSGSGDDYSELPREGPFDNLLGPDAARKKQADLLRYKDRKDHDMAAATSKHEAIERYAQLHVIKRINVLRPTSNSPELLQRELLNDKVFQEQVMRVRADKMLPFVQTVLKEVYAPA